MKVAVIDRIVDGKRLVLLVGEEEREYVYSDETSQFKEGDWVTVNFSENGNIASIIPNPDKTKEQRDSIRDKMAKLRAKKGSRFQS